MSVNFKYQLGPMTVVQLPALEDNYIYILRFENSAEVAVVDPSEAAPVIKYLEEHKLRLTKILNTHHHHDHVDGNLELKDRYACKIYCSNFDFHRVPGADHPLIDGDCLKIGRCEFEIFDVPGHTLGAITYCDLTNFAAFTGDTLFTLGCGRLFEGSFSQMHSSLSRLKQLNRETQIFCGHEYTWQNLMFSLKLAQDAENTSLIAKLEAKKQAVSKLLQAKAPTVPSRLSEELELNPFLTAANIEDFERVRRLKDQFRLEP